jgi:hypothetical protein
MLKRQSSKPELQPLILAIVIMPGIVKIQMAN